MTYKCEWKAMVTANKLSKIGLGAMKVAGNKKIKPAARTFSIFQIKAWLPL